MQPLPTGRPVNEVLDHDGVVAALQGRLGDHWTVTVRAGWPGAPLVAMFSGALQKAEPKDDGPPGETDFVWYIGSDDRTFGAFSIPSEGFRHAQWEPTPRGPALMVHASGMLLALFPRSVED
jgi:hypothetical protein